MLDLEIREQLARYAKKRLKLEKLNAWLEERSWDLDDASPEARGLLYEAMRLIAEHSNGDWTDQELRERMGALSRTYWIVNAPKVPVGSSSNFTLSPLAMRANENR